MNGTVVLSRPPNAVKGRFVHKRLLSNICMRALERVMPLSLGLVSAFALDPYLIPGTAFDIDWRKLRGREDPATAFGAVVVAGASVLPVVTVSAAAALE